MRYKNVAITTIVIILLSLLAIVYLCFSNLSMSFGYKNSWTEQSGSNSEDDGITVVIDAGHGGIDPGAVANGLVEKELNLSVAKKLEQFLKLSNVNVVMTRTEDVLLGDGDTVRAHKAADLRERLSIAEQIDNAVFVSIHMNKFDSEYVHGLQTFYASSTEGSQELAQSIQNSVTLLDKDNKREIKPDSGNIYVLENTTRTAVLVECGFLSNTKEAKLLSDGGYQNSLAFIIYIGIINYIQENENENSVCLR